MVFHAAFYTLHVVRCSILHTCLMLHAACFASHFAQVTQSATLRVALSALSVARHLADPRARDTWHLRGRAVGDADLVARRHRPAHQHRRPPPRHRRHQRMLLIARAVRRAMDGRATGSWENRLLAKSGVCVHARVAHNSTRTEKPICGRRCCAALIPAASALCAAGTLQAVLRGQPARALYGAGASIVYGRTHRSAGGACV